MLNESSDERAGGKRRPEKGDVDMSCYLIKPSSSRISKPCCFAKSISFWRTVARSEFRFASFIRAMRRTRSSTSLRAASATAGRVLLSSRFPAIG